MDVLAGVHLQPRAASERLVESLAASDDPVLAYKASLLAGTDPDSARAATMRGRIPGSPMARELLRVFEQDARTLHHTYRKWQGPHWTLTCLAMIDYPPADQALRPLVRLVHDWLFSKHFLEPPLTRSIPDRRAGSGTVRPWTATRSGTPSGSGWRRTAPVRWWTG